MRVFLMTGAVIALSSLAACNRDSGNDATTAATPARAATIATTAPVAPAASTTRALAKEAYVYGYPMVDNYRIMHSYFVDKTNPEYRGGWNEVHNTARVYTPDDKTIQTPNSDTPYSIVGYDLRAEPLVVTVPPVDPKRYYSLQFLDLYTANFAYLGSRASGSKGGTYLLAGPDWKGETPKGIDRVIRSETQIGNIFYRTQLFGADDLPNVKKVQAGYKVQPLSAFLGQPAPAPAAPIDFIAPLTSEDEKTSPRFFEVLDFLLRFAPTVPEDAPAMQRFAKLGIGADGTFKADALAPADRAAIQAGMADAWADVEALKVRIDKGEVTSGDLFGDRARLKGNHLYRMVAAATGIYGNSREEAMYPVLSVDQAGQRLDGSKRYTLRFAPGQLPPVNAFWSVTMYELPSSLLVANPIDRYLINAPMLPNLKKDADGGITLYIQNASPGKDKEANWLPAPKGPFLMAMRLYWPKAEALDGTWKAPVVQVAP